MGKILSILNINREARLRSGQTGYVSGVHNLVDDPIWGDGWEEEGDENGRGVALQLRNEFIDQLINWIWPETAERERFKLWSIVFDNWVKVFDRLSVTYYRFGEFLSLLLFTCVFILDDMYGVHICVCIPVLKISYVFVIVLVQAYTCYYCVWSCLSYISLIYICVIRTIFLPGRFHFYFVLFYFRHNGNIFGCMGAVLSM